MTNKTPLKEDGSIEWDNVTIEGEGVVQEEVNPSYTEAQIVTRIKFLPWVNSLRS